MMHYLKMYLLLFVVLFVHFSLVASNPVKRNISDNYFDYDYEDESELVPATYALGNDIIDLSMYGRLLYGKPDPKVTGTAVSRYDYKSKVNPEELGSYMEGDILFPINRNGLKSKSHRWTNGVVPYVIKGTFNTKQKAIIDNAIKEFHSKTCVRFKPKVNEKDYIAIISGDTGCWSAIGRIGGKQEVNLQPSGCFSQQGTVLHELMHVVGFLHEQNRSIRDDYVTINNENIKSGSKKNFIKSNASTCQSFGIGYDYQSVMHYSAYAFSSNGKPTIVPKKPTRKIGQRVGFSDKDLQKINKMYQCMRRAPNKKKPRLGL